MGRANQGRWDGKGRAVAPMGGALRVHRGASWTPFPSRWEGGVHRGWGGGDQPLTAGITRDP
ncbi:hypothetical protein GCM10017668_57940 [Streptomyces tuirus]|uniref:Uncharacterized protein n=1 Tax=Streptomyces tuirus TaxID=68278 RepID=A0A7G1NN22_9ACTN|nr:hypothetical protein GCM10017668_57940 [Streptomyces tuirus]